LRLVGRYYVTMLNRELVSRGKLCLVSVSQMFSKIALRWEDLLRSFENVASGVQKGVFGLNCFDGLTD